LVKNRKYSSILRVFGAFVDGDPITISSASLVSKMESTSYQPALSVHELPAGVVRLMMSLAASRQYASVATDRRTDMFRQHTQRYALHVSTCGKTTAATVAVLRLYVLACTHDRKCLSSGTRLSGLSFSGPPVL